MEVFATYLVLPSPRCAPLVGQPIGKHRELLDAFGAKLTTLALPGDGWRIRHDALKHLLFREIRGHGVPSTCEFFGLFARLLSQRTRDDVAQAPLRKRQGLVPDFLVTLPTGIDTLMELKVVGLGRTWYVRGDTARCRAVAHRAREIPAEYVQKTRRLDGRSMSDPHGSPGHVEQKLASYGRIHALAFGAFGEASQDVHSLVNDLACGRAARDWPRLLCRDQDVAKALLDRSLYRSLGLEAVRSQARLKLAGLSHVGTGVAAASRRRANSEAFHTRTREAYQLHHSGRRQRQ